MAEKTQTEMNETEWRIQIFDSLSFPTLIIRPDKTIIAANKKFLEKNKTSNSEVVGKSCKDIFFNTTSLRHHVCDSESCPLQKVIQSKKTTSLVLKSEDKNGQEIWEQRVFAPIFDSDDEVAYIIESFRDVSELKDLENKYSDVRELVDKVVHSSVSGIIAADRSGKIIIMNEAAESLFGVSVPEAARVNIETFYPPGVARKIMKCLRDDTPMACQAFIRYCSFCCTVLQALTTLW